MILKLMFRNAADFNQWVLGIKNKGIFKSSEEEQIREISKLKEDQILMAENVDTFKNNSPDIFKIKKLTAREALSDYDNDTTKKFVRILRNNEKVIASGLVLKHENVVNKVDSSLAPKQRRILLFTNSPRLIFIDPIGNIVRGNLELTDSSIIRINKV